MSPFSLVLVALLAAAVVRAEEATNSWPPTEKKPATDHYGATTVTDDYRWLEDAASPAVKEWTAAENKYTRAWLDALTDRAPIQAQLTKWSAQRSPSYFGLVARPGRLFALKNQPPRQQPLLVTLTSADDLSSEKTLLDPNALEPAGQVAMDWYAASQDGGVVAVCLSVSGSEAGALTFYRTETGEKLPDHLERVQFPTAGGGAAFTRDGQAVYYTRYPAAGERAESDRQFYQQIYLHRLGTPQSEDRLSLGEDFPRIAEVELTASRQGRWVLARVANGDGGEYAHYVLDQAAAAPAWQQIAGFSDGVKEAVLAADEGSLYLRSVEGAPRSKVLRLPLSGPLHLTEATVVVPESEAVIEGLTATPAHLYVVDLLGGPSRLREFDPDGGHPREIATGAATGLSEVISLRDRPDDDRLLYQQSGFLEPNAWYRCGPGSPPMKTALSSTAPVNFDDVEAVREFALSADGTKVPLTILRRKGTKLDGTNPVVLSGYGGYGVSLRPRFEVARRYWFDRGGIYAVANLRGGGEYGEAWHLAGNLTRKQNVFDDFAACAQHLIERGYTRPEKLAVEGGSNGGLLMGAFLTQHPGLARAVVSHVGIYDMLRVELEPNGAFNVTEFGSVQDPAQFRALYAYSPYHHVVDGTTYPAVFLLSGENDGRVNPYNSRKMAARLQAATGSQRPILLRLSASSGHGMGTPLTERISQEADVLAFLVQELGVH